MGKHKRERKKQPTQGPLTGSWTHVVRILLFSASIITAYLALATLSKGGQVPGCGPESDCEKVLTSSWAYWLGIPVSLLGLGLYGAFFFITFSLKIGQQQKARRSLNSLTVFSFIILGAAVWFIGVQALAIGTFCPYCCTAHGMASLAAVIFLSQANNIGARLSARLNFGIGICVALGLVMVVVAGQIFLPKEQPAPKMVNLSQPQPNTPIIKTKPESAFNSEPSTPAVKTVTPTKPTPTKAGAFHIPKSDLSLDISRLPLLGPIKAPHRIGCLFDYTCHHCRQLHGYIIESIQKLRGQVSCVMIPMPLDSNCNATIKRTGRDHVNACKYARICLAVQQVAPTKYYAFDRWLFSDHKTAKPLDTVKQYASKLVGADVLDKAIASATVQQQLQQNIHAYELNSKNGRSSFMPQTIINNQVIFGPPPSAAALETAIKQTLGLK